MGLEMVVWTVSSGGGRCGETWTWSWLTKEKGTIMKMSEAGLDAAPKWNFMESIYFVQRWRKGGKQGFQRVGWVSLYLSLVSSLLTYLPGHQFQLDCMSLKCLTVSSPMSPRHFIRQIKTFLPLLRCVLFFGCIGSFFSQICQKKKKRIKYQKSLTVSKLLMDDFLIMTVKWLFKLLWWKIN